VNGEEIFLCFMPQKAEGVENLLRVGESGEWLQVLMVLFLDGQRFIYRLDLFQFYRFQLRRNRRIIKHFFTSHVLSPSEWHLEI
jgi:hypothetical protein